MDIEISRLTLKELRDRLRDRRLPISGTRRILIQRLQEEFDPSLKVRRIAEEERLASRIANELLVRQELESIERKERLAEEKQVAEKERVEEKKRDAELKQVREEIKRIYRATNKKYSMKRAGMVKWLTLGLFFAILLIITVVQKDMSTKTWQVYLVTSLCFASFSSAIGTATTTRQWASSLSDKNPIKHNFHTGAVIWVNCIIIPVSFAYAFYLKSPSWFEEYHAVFDMESLRNVIMLALVWEILIDLWAAKYIAKKSEPYDRLLIWVFLVTESIAVTVSYFDTLVPNYILFAVGLMFSIGHLYGAKDVETGVVWLGEE